MTNDELEQRLDVLAKKIDGELERLEARIIEIHDIWRGVKHRVDRQVGTMDDLLKRFEAWKTIGNNMQEQLKAIADALAAQGDSNNASQALFANHSEQLKLLSLGLAAHTEVLKELQAAIVGDHGDGEAKPVVPS